MESLQNPGKLIALVLIISAVSASVSCGDKGDGKDSYICTETFSAETMTPQGFNISPSQAIDKAKPFFVENPFALIVYADDRYYYVDIASKAGSPERAKLRGVKIDARTGEILRGEKRYIGK